MKIHAQMAFFDELVKVSMDTGHFKAAQGGSPRETVVEDVKDVEVPQLNFGYYRKPQTEYVDADIVSEKYIQKADMGAFLAGKTLHPHPKPRESRVKF